MIERYPMEPSTASFHGCSAVARAIAGTVFVSGMVGIDVATGELPESIQDQTRQSIRNCATVLEAGEASLDDVTMVTVLLADPQDFGGMNEAYAEAFGENPPARAVARLGPELPGIRVSIFMTAHVED